MTSADLIVAEPVFGRLAGNFLGSTLFSLRGNRDSSYKSGADICTNGVELGKVRLECRDVTEESVRTCSVSYTNKKKQALGVQELGKSKKDEKRKTHFDFPPSVFTFSSPNCFNAFPQSSR